MSFDKVNIIASIILIVIASIAYYPVVMVYADEIQEETQVTDKVELQVVSEEDTKEKVVVVEKKLTHRVSVTGNFDGVFDHELINTEGKFRISSDVDTFVLVGTFENAVVQHWSPISGVYVTSNPNCQNISGDLVLESTEAKINIDFNGKNCTYGLTSYVIGTFETTESVGKYEGIVGEGSITFVADHHTNNVSGQLKGSFR